MPVHEGTPADHGQPSPGASPETGGQLHYTLGHAGQNPLNDRLRRRAAILAFMVLFGAGSAPKVFSGGWGPAVLWSGWLLVLASLFALTILAMRRRSKAERRGVRLLDPAEPERGPEASAARG